MKEYIKCDLYLCTGNNIELDSSMETTDKILRATKVKRQLRGDMEIICVKDDLDISPDKCSYVKEILTGIKIPVIGIKYTYGEKFIGEVDKPYCATASCRYESDKTTGKNVLKLRSMVTPEVLKAYADSHKDEDGTYNTYKKQLQDMINGSIETYNSIEIKPYYFIPNRLRTRK